MSTGSSSRSTGGRSIFNPSFPYRLVHMVIAAYLSTALAVGAVGAWHLLRDREQPAGPHDVLDGACGWRRGGAAADRRRRPARPQHARAPAGQARGHRRRITETPRGPPLILSAFPTCRPRPSRYAIDDPELGSLILTHDLDGAAQGPRRISRARTGPPVDDPVLAFRMMVGLGLLMIAIGLCSLVAALARAALYDRAGCMRLALAMGPLGFVAVIAGWITTEVGRQPCTVYGLLRTADSVSPIAARRSAPRSSPSWSSTSPCSAPACSTSSGSWRRGPQRRAGAARDPRPSARPASRPRAAVARTSRSMMPPSICR